MVDLILTTFHRASEIARSYARDIRVRQAWEETGLPYRMQSAPL